MGYLREKFFLNNYEFLRDWNNGVISDNDKNKFFNKLEYNFLKIEELNFHKSSNYRRTLDFYNKLKGNYELRENDIEFMEKLILLCEPNLKEIVTQYITCKRYKLGTEYKLNLTRICLVGIFIVSLILVKWLKLISL